jgi:hypothetical protein
MIQLVAVVCMLLSAKYLEKTYPGVQKLNSIIQSPFAYDDFIAMEQNILRVLDWEMFLITPFDIVNHFLAQGVIFTSDRVWSKTANDYN